MPFGSERSLVETNPLKAQFYHWYGALSIGDKIRARYVFRILRSQLMAMTQNLLVLDAGCGSGPYALRLAQEYPSLLVTALDVEGERIGHVKQAVARLGLNNIQAVSQSLLNLDSHDEYNLVLCVDVLEHVEQDEEAASRLAAALEPGGILVVHVPQRNQRHYRIQVDWHAYGHVREGYSLAELCALLHQTGLELVHCRHTFGLWGGLSADLDESLFRYKLLWLLLLPVILVLAWLDGRVNNRRGNGLLVVARKPLQTATQRQSESK